MVAKPRVQIGKLAVIGVIGSQFEHAMVARGSLALGLTLGRLPDKHSAGQSGQSQSDGQNAHHCQ